MNPSKPNTKHANKSEFTHFGGGVFGLKEKSSYKLANKRLRLKGSMLIIKNRQDEIMESIDNGTKAEKYERKWFKQITRNCSSFLLLTLLSFVSNSVVSQDNNDSVYYNAVKKYASDIKKCSFLPHLNENDQVTQVDTLCTIDKIESLCDSQPFIIFDIGRFDNDYLVALDKKKKFVYDSISYKEFNKLADLNCNIDAFQKSLLFLMMNGYGLDRLLITKPDLKDITNKNCILCKYIDVNYDHRVMSALPVKGEPVKTKSLDCPLKVNKILFGQIKTSFCAQGLINRRDVYKHEFKFNNSGKIVKYKKSNTKKKYDPLIR